MTPQSTTNLTEPQRVLLSNLFNTDHGSLYLRGRDIRMGRRLARLGLAAMDGQHWCTITAAGRALHRDLWECAIRG